MDKPSAARTPRVPTVVLLTLAALGVGSACARGEVRSYRAAVVRSALAQRDASPPPTSAALVENALHDAGLRFGTDGSVGALYHYLKRSHGLIDARDAQPGDIVFFDLSDGGRSGCANHAGVVESVGGGRIAFIESRAGQTRRSFVTPTQPVTRRNAEGRIANSFLRTMDIDDRDDARYFAGQMFCAVARVR